MKNFLIATVLVSLSIAPLLFAQFGGPFGGRERPLPDRSEFPMWKIAPDFDSDVFAFARIKYSSEYMGRGNRWSNDFPDSDWNFSYRLHQMTTLAVDPNGRYWS